MSIKKEVRVDNYQDAIKYSNQNIDIISIGSECCFYKIPTMKQLLSLFVNTDKEIKLVLPFISQQHLQSTLDLIHEIIHCKLSIIIVVNDYGILNYIMKQQTSYIKLHIGRFLDWSYDLIPWNSNILRDETKANKEYLTSSVFIHKKKLEFLKESNVVAVELNMLKDMEHIIKKFLEYNISVFIHYKYNVVAYSRACPNKRLYENSICNINCGEYNKLKFRKKWMPKKEFNSSVSAYKDDQKVSKLFSVLYVKNNMVLKEKPMEIADYIHLNVEGIILDEYIKEIDDFLEVSE